MLKKLKIKNFGLIADVELDFHKGLNIITGESGAGKTMLSKSISFLRGEKFKADIIKHGESSLEVIGYFNYPDYKNILGFEDYLESSEIIIKAKKTNENTKYYINDIIASSTKLQDITNILLNVAEQNSHTKLTKTTHQLDFIDSFISNEIKSEKEIIKNKLKEKKDIQEQIASLSGDLKFKEARIDFIKKQMKEIQSLNIGSESLEEIQSKLDKFKNITASVDFFNSIEESLFGDESIDSLSFKSKNIIKKSIFKNDQFATGIIEDLDSIDLILNNIRKKISDEKKDFSNLDESEVAELQEKAENLKKIVKKYGSIEGIQSKLLALKEEYDYLNSLDAKIADFNADIEKIENTLIKNCEIISQKRLKIIPKLSKNILIEMQSLNLENAKFEIRLDRKSIDESGFDKPLFLFSANKSELGLIDHIASGGEISRLALAISIVSSNENEINILDEIDTGIGGNTGISMGDSIKKLSEKSQVICITHLPQIAILADQHIVLEKNMKNQIVESTAKVLQEKTEIIHEISRMLGNTQNKEETIKFAEKLYNTKKIKNHS